MGMFSIWHLLILLIAGLFFAGGVTLVVWLCTRAAGKPRPGSAPLGPQQRLQQLEELRGKGLISEAEYQQQRSAILSGI